jgi:hypothetical protein
MKTEPVGGVEEEDGYHRMAVVVVVVVVVGEVGRGAVMFGVGPKSWRCPAFC